MAFRADYLLDRALLKSHLANWRALAILFGVLFLLALTVRSFDSVNTQIEHIARIEIEDIILQDRERDMILNDIAEDENIKAVILHINSPGGTMVGGETLYRALSHIAEKKPLVAVLGSVAASGGYMAAVASDYIVSHQGTITGSIGVMFQTAEVTELSKKLGIEFITFKSGELKGSPSPLEKISEKAKKVVDASVKDSYEVFVQMVAEGREALSIGDVRKLSDGRIYTGRQAFTHKLVDALGGEEDAITWLGEQGEEFLDMEIKDRTIYKELEGLRKFYAMIMGKDDYFSAKFRGGMMVLWDGSQYF